MTMPDEKDSATARSTDRMQANYSYTFEVSEESPNRAAVSVQAILLVDNTRIPVQAAGTIQSYQIAESDYLWEGPLDGFATYLNEPCRIVIGFAKLDSSSDIQLTITGQDKNLAGISYVLGSVMTPEIEQAMFDYADASTQPKIIAQNAVCSSNAVLPEDYNLISGRYAEYDDVNNDNFSQFVRLYFSEGSNLVVFTLTTFVRELENYYSHYNNYVGYNHDPHIHSFSMRLIATDTAFNDESNRSHIIGMYASPEVIDSSASNILLTVAFASVFETLAIPGGTLFNTFIERCLTGLRGNVSTADTLYSASLSVEFSATQKANFDGTNYLGFPMVVKLGVDNPSVYDGNSPYQYESSVRYRVPTTLGTVNPTLVYTYLDAQDISYTTMLSLSA